VITCQELCLVIIVFVKFYFSVGIGLLPKRLIALRRCFWARIREGTGMSLHFVAIMFEKRPRHIWIVRPSSFCGLSSRVRLKILGFFKEM